MSPAPEPRRHTGPERVVILGGGVGGVTAAFALTQPELRGRCEVTLYQMGWRLGGKGRAAATPTNTSASRNTACTSRWASTTTRFR